MTAGKEIELNPALFLNEDYLPLFRVNYITNDSTKPLNISISTEPFKNDNGHVLNVEYFMEDYFYVKKDNGEFVVYDSENEPKSWETAKDLIGRYTKYECSYDSFNQSKLKLNTEDNNSDGEYEFRFTGINRHITEIFHWGIDYSPKYYVDSLNYESMKYSVTVSAKFTDDISSLRENNNFIYVDISENMNKVNEVNEEIKQEIKKKESKQKKIFIPKNVDRAYDLSVLNTSSNYPLDKIISGVQNFANQWKNGTNKVKTCTLLFHGFPGTGKTEFGKYLSAQTGLSFTVKRASEVFDKYVGETEKILSSIFLNARSNKSILMIDEADSFLESRTNADHTWEISKVNELLCQLEQHEGIVICSTNFLSNIDSAALRRFIFKIEFKTLTNEGKHIMAQRMLSEVCDIPDDLTELNEINLLTPGDFKAVRDRLLIINNDKISWEEVLKEIKTEIQYKMNDDYYKKFKFN